MADNRDRRTNMVNSSINQPAKKGGAGGAYTWGSALDVTDYGIPQGVQAFPSAGVVIQAAPQQVFLPAQPLQVNMNDAMQFPTLGATVVSGPVSWGPTNRAANAVSYDNLRPGAAQLFDGQHPRNTFAPKARHVVQAGQVQTIDWSQAGIPNESLHQIVRGMQAPSHTYTGPAPRVTMETLRGNVISAQPPPPQHIFSQGSRPVMQQQGFNRGYRN